MDRKLMTAAVIGALILAGCAHVLGAHPDQAAARSGWTQSIR